MKRFLLVLLTLSLLLAAGAGVASWIAWNRLDRPIGEPGAEPRTLVVEPGQPAGRILERLEQEGVIASAFWTRLYLVYYLGDPSLKAGEYRFDGALSARQVVDKLVRGEVVTHTVTLIEGMDRWEIAEHLATEGFGEREAFAALVDNPEPIADLDPEATSLEGYLFPDTYAFERHTPERDIVAKLVATFRQRYRDSVRPRLLARPDDARPALREIVVLASIVEKEAALDDERPLIAGVYRNRLERGMGLFADPTVIYALKLAGTWDGNLRRDDLDIDSPYNTYRYPGLPPAPICSPGLESLLAATEPAEVPHLYFVSRNDGSHVFSNTLAEHNRNVQLWQKRYWQERWARERRENASGEDGH